MKLITAACIKSAIWNIFLGFGIENRIFGTKNEINGTNLKIKIQVMKGMTSGIENNFFDFGTKN